MISSHLRNLIFSAAILIAAIAVQSTAMLSILSVKPNITLAVLVVFSFFAGSFFQYLVFLVVAALFLPIDPGLTSEVLRFLGLGTVIFILRKRLFAPSFYANAILMAVATLGLFLLFSPSLIFTRVFLIELVYNELIASLCFMLFSFLNRRVAS